MPLVGNLVMPLDLIYILQLFECSHRDIPIFELQKVRYRSLIFHLPRGCCLHNLIKVAKFYSYGLKLVCLKIYHSYVHVLVLRSEGGTS